VQKGEKRTPVLLFVRFRRKGDLPDSILDLRASLLAAIATIKCHVN
jgi:hypothetical protein